jgi:glycosyltransferase involved in cell wall biosynthesis
MTSTSRTTLNVVLEELLSPSPGGVRRYTEELARQLILTAPSGCEVVGIVSAVPDEAVDAIRSTLPGIADIRRLPLGHRETVAAWPGGLTTRDIRGMVHAPSLFAPLRKRRGGEAADQVAVTIHDTLAWTHPESLGAGTAIWTKAMAKRARKHADAVVVPTHAVAARLADELDFGDRIRVIGGAPATALRLPPDADERAARLTLPETYALTLGSIMPRKGVAPLIRAVARPEAHGIPLLIAGPDRFGDGSATGVAAAAGLPEDRVRALGQLEDATPASQRGSGCRSSRRSSSASRSSTPTSRPSWRSRAARASSSNAPPPPTRTRAATRSGSPRRSAVCSTTVPCASA